MKEIWGWIQVAFAAIGGVLGWYLGEIDGLVYVQIAFCVIDWIIGAIRYGIVDKTLTSSLGFRKAFEKLLIFVLVGVANIVDNEILGQGQVLRNVVVFFYISAEGVSILEHAGHMGLPIPKKLMSILRELQQPDEKPGENDDTPKE